MSFLYPRVVGITRPTQAMSPGINGYGGQVPSTETAVASGLPASIQYVKQRGPEEARLPGDSHKTEWRVFIPLAAIARGLIETRDIVTDDAGQRYQVIAPYWDSLGYQLTCELLEA
jgi:hypothetical protein